MNAKLTLKLDKKTIERAKAYARRTNQSLSAIVENYFKLLSEKQDAKEMEISPTVQELSGIISLDDDYDFKDDYQHYLLEKYK